MAPSALQSWPGRMGGWAPRSRRALLEGTAQVRAVVRRAGGRMPLRESPSTDVADDGAPCPRAAATAPTPGTPPTPRRRKSVGSRPFRSARVPGAMKSRRYDFYACSVPLRVGREQLLAAAQAWDEGNEAFPER